MDNSQAQSALLALENGTVLHGVAFGRPGTRVGELVFNTAMSGYQEILSDPSYCRQMVTFSYPHIGNVGINDDDMESAKCYVEALLVHDLSPHYSNWRAETSLAEFCDKHGIVGISQVDTRFLTQKLRDQGAMQACISTELSAQEAIMQAQSSEKLAGMDLAKVVTCSKAYTWSQGSLTEFYHLECPTDTKLHVVVIDFGVKQTMLRLLVDRGCQVTVVPATADFDTIMSYKPDGVLLSNGPGDPSACQYAIDTIKALLEHSVPMFGICLGYQLLALATGAKTSKMKFGHHGANHPVMDLDSKTVFVTSQNHGFQVDASTLPDSVEASHRSLFDDSLQGIRCKNKPAFGFQGHPEASPGPRDVLGLFDQFISMMR